MPTLNSPNDKLQLVTGSGVSTDYAVVYTDTGVVRFEDGTLTSDGNVTTATTTDIVGSPQARVVRRVLEICVRNKHASSTQTVTLQKSVNGTAVALTPAVTLAAGEMLMYRTNTGFQVFDSSGRLKTSASGTFRPSQLMANPAFQTNDITSTVALGTGWCAASYMGKAPRALDWATIRAKITTAVSVGAGEWAQVGIATGDLVPGAAPTLTLRGFTSVEGTWNSTGLKSTVVSTAGINEGDGLWVVAGCSGGTGAAILKIQAGLADNVQTGAFAVVSNEPNQILGTPTAFVLMGAAVSAPQLFLIT